MRRKRNKKGTRLEGLAAVIIMLQGMIIAFLWWKSTLGG
jgi:hypothetical protein